MSTTGTTRSRGMARGVLEVAALALVLLGPSTAAGSAPAPATASQEAAGAPAPAARALDLAFRLASAIASDPADRGRAMEEAVLDLARAGDPDGAASRAEAIEGWRKGTAFASLAAEAARTGRPGPASRLLSRAEAERSRAGGWQERRIAARIAEAMAAMGRREDARTLGEELAAGDTQYAAMAPSATAAAKAAEGDAGGAMEALAPLDGALDLDTAWARTRAYVEVARAAPAGGGWALESARRSAAGLPGWKRAEGLILVGEAMAEAGHPAVREVLDEAEALARALPATMPVKPALMTALARTLASARQRERALA
ncbi:MAG TPA: hypothetical protein VJV23_08705, partial [Candidatus Polarisedimenticolia bacterium]|nr:hypothetical protein [Candidatus Polarisedimenticolia bacterium]